IVSKASEDLPDPDKPVNTTSLSRGIDSVTFFRLCSRAPRIVIWSVGIRTLGYSFSLVTANVALAVATSLPSPPSTRHSATTVRRPAWMTWLVARRSSPTLAALMKLSFRSKLIARTTPGFSVRTERPMAESASVLIIPPCTKPEWLAMSSVVVICTTAVPSPASTSRIPSHSQAREGVSPPPRRGTSPRGGEATFLFTALALRHGHTGRGRARDEPALLVHHVGLAEVERLLHLDDAPDGPQTSFDDRTQEVDLQLDRRVPQPILLEGAQRHPHGRVGDLGDHAALHDAATMPVLRAGLELQHHAARFGLGDARAQCLHPSGGLGRQQRLRAVQILYGPRRVFLQLRTVVRCLGAAAIASATSVSSSLADSSPARRLRSAMIRSRTRAASSNCSSFDSRRISFSRSRTMASRSSRGTPAPIISSTASAWMSLAWMSSA